MNASQVRTAVPFVFLIALIVIAFWLRGLIVDLQTGLADQRAQNQQTAIQQAAACRARKIGREDQDVHVKQPLRDMLLLFATLAKEGAVKQTTVAQRTRSLKFELKFEAFAAKVKPLPPLTCSSTRPQ